MKKLLALLLILALTFTACLALASCEFTNGDGDGAGKGDGNLPYIVGEYVKRGGEVMTLEPHLKVFDGLAALENGESLPEGVVAYRTNDEAFDTAVAALRVILNTL